MAKRSRNMGQYAEKDAVGEVTLNTNESQKTSPRYKSKKCKVLRYDKKSKALDISFNGYGVRIDDVDPSLANQDYVLIKYLGVIGKPNFFCKV